MLKDYHIKKPGPVVGYQLHTFVQTLTDGKSPLFADRGDHIIVRTEDHLPGEAHPVAQPSQGDVLAFALDACVVVRKTRGKRVYPSDNDKAARINWLRNKAQQHGFEVVAFHVTPNRKRIDDGKGRDFTVDATTFTGVMRVTDADRFASVVRNGLTSSAKAFGLGLIQF